jgi:hypothetical protein
VHSQHHQIQKPIKECSTNIENDLDEDLGDEDGADIILLLHYPSTCSINTLLISQPINVR